MNHPSSELNSSIQAENKTDLKVLPTTFGHHFLDCCAVLSPLLLFFILFIGSGVYFSLQNNQYAFYQVSATVAILPAIILAFYRIKEPIKKSLYIFLQGARDENIIIMCLIYLLAGAFANVLQQIGGVQSFVNLTLSIVPKGATLPALFLIASVVSTAMGTSMGTIAAVGPIGVGLAQSIGLSLPLTMGTIIGGAMFGDNLSMISDTSIAATQIHGCSIKEKFKSNARIAMPCMIVTVILLSLFAYFDATRSTHLMSSTDNELSTVAAQFISPRLASNNEIIPDLNSYQLIHGIPYIMVLGLALLGQNVFIVLILGIISAGLVGVFTIPEYNLVTLSQNIFEGYKNMAEILILSLLMGGLGELIKYKGGFKKLTQLLEYLFFTNQKSNPRTAEISVCALVSVSDICTANNTAAIILSGEATKEIARQNQICPIRTATLVDIFSCVFQGVLPYSAQVLMAGSLAFISPLAIIPYVYYCFILGLAGIMSVIFHKK